PPAESLAMLCHFVPLLTTVRWEVLGRTADRCGATRLLGSVDSGYGRNVRVPRAGRNQVVFARIHGAGISGLERLRTLLYRSTFRNVVVNGGAAGYRLVPGTAADGLIMSAPRSADFPVP